MCSTKKIHTFKYIQLFWEPWSKSFLSLKKCANSWKTCGSFLMPLINPTHHCEAQRWNFRLFSKFTSNLDGSIKSLADREDQSGISVSFSVTVGDKQKLVGRKDAGFISKHQIFFNRDRESTESLQTLPLPLQPCPYISASTLLFYGKIFGDKFGHNQTLYK